MKKTIYILLLFIFLFLTSFLFSEESIFSNNLSQYTNLKDSINYSADSILYDFENNKVILSGKANVNYGDRTLSSESIFLNTDTKKLLTKDETYLKGNSEKLIGKATIFSLESEKGIYYHCMNEFDMGYSYGEEIRRTGKDYYDIEHGYFTTCEYEDPHFAFKSSKMRVFQGDKVVAKPVVAYINNFPVFALPAMSFSISRRRHSGFLTPTPGTSSSNGKYINNLGYFIAAGDHCDILYFMNLSERSGWDQNFSMKYLDRYDYNGAFTYTRSSALSNSGRSTKNDDEFHLTHHHKLKNEATLNADINYVSSESVTENSTDVDTRLDKEISSNISYIKPVLNRSLSVNASYTDNIETHAKSLVLPSVSYSVPSKPIYEFFVSETPQDTPWWKGFSMSYSFTGQHTGSITDTNASFTEIFYKGFDTTNSLVTHKIGAKNDFSFSYSKKLFFINTSHGISGLEAWGYDRHKEKWIRGASASYSSSASFDLYGVSNFGNFYLKGIKHTFRPSLSYSYKPDFSKVNKAFSENSSDFLYTPDCSAKSEAVKIDFSNYWDIKLNPLGKVEEKKISRILSASFSYNVSDDIFSDISYSSSLNTNDILPFFQKVSLGTFSLTPANSHSANAKQDFYSLDILNWDYTMTSSLNLAYSFTQDITTFFIPKENILKTNKIFNPDYKYTPYKKNKYTNSFSASFSHTYKISEDLANNTPLTKNQTFATNGSLTFYLSSTMKLTYSTSYNIEENYWESQSLSIVKDLHCFNLNFSFTKSGDVWSYNLSIFNVKLPSELKYEESKDSND